VKRTLVAAAAAAVVALLPWTTPEARVLPSTRIMVVGDSLSHGYAGDWSWRYWVGRELRRQGVHADFVGPHRLPYRGTRYERPTPWDDDHASIAGSTVDAHLGLITDEMRAYRPDVVVVELGYNDVARGDDATTVVSQLEELITLAQQASPEVRVVLAEVTSTESRAYDPVSAEVNARMAAWALLHGVTVAHNRTGAGPGALLWDPVRLTWDGLHPNAAGQTLFAQRVAEAFHTIGLLPSEPALLYSARTWSPDPRPAVSAVRDGAVVGWATVARELCITGVQVLVDGVARTGWRAVPGRQTEVRLALTPGRHLVQLVVRRSRMVATPGGAVAVDVP